jgi:hypothetical protein
VTFVVLKQWRQDLPTGAKLGVGDFGLTERDLAFLSVAGLVEISTQTVEEPAKLKPKKRKD